MLGPRKAALYPASMGSFQPKGWMPVTLTDHVHEVGRHVIRAALREHREDRRGRDGELR